MKIAFYGRYSSDNQRDTSITDQRRIVERWAERHGHDIVGNYSDSAVSGASLHALKGLQCDRCAITRRAGYLLSQQKRKRIEEILGGTARVGWMFVFGLAVYNLIRLRNLTKRTV